MIQDAIVLPYMCISSGYPRVVKIKARTNILTRPGAVATIDNSTITYIILNVNVKIFLNLLKKLILFYFLYRLLHHEYLQGRPQQPLSSSPH